MSESASWATPSVPFDSMSTLSRPRTRQHSKRPYMLTSRPDG